ncbi:MAG: 1-deoxy-D-xylulose-5-phosphate reductoisomerase, partial [Desulfovibrionaceae bacterium]|nr:1-deoxy-D-xylulose-5-phosphate reductoisomerase [Desulfovibrionaceae bacterium]
IVILGSTGSIGCNALAVIAKASNSFSVQGLACGQNVTLLAKQSEIYRPPYLAVQTNQAKEALQKLLPENYRPQILVGSQGYAQLAQIPEATTVLSAQAGSAGLSGTLAAALAGKVILLANKESLVLAGSLVRDIVKITQASILPVDSEHNALFQALAGREQDVASLILTASGGPFRGQTSDKLALVTPEQALKHPNWKMGKKITIDSATMMNKGLEVIEAFHLYGVQPEQIEVLIHPQSLVHSLVRFKDGGLLGQFGVADMKLPLAHCLLWPTLLPKAVERCDLTKVELNFSHPDLKAFPCLALAKRALKERGGMCVVLNAANEVAVELFLAKKCGFMDIPRLIKVALDAHAKKALGHKSFCPPLREGYEGSWKKADLAARVAEIEQKIETLDRQTRSLVRACHLQGDSLC